MKLLIWSLVFAITSILLEIWIIENNKNFGLLFLYMALYLGISLIINKYIGI